MIVLRVCGHEVIDHEFEVKEWIDFEAQLCDDRFRFQTHIPRKEALPHELYRPAIRRGA